MIIFCVNSVSVPAGINSSNTELLDSELRCPKEPDYSAAKVVQVLKIT